MPVSAPATKKKIMSGTTASVIQSQAFVPACTPSALPMVMDGATSIHQTLKRIVAAVPSGSQPKKSDLIVSIMKSVNSPPTAANPTPNLRTSFFICFRAS